VLASTTLFFLMGLFEFVWGLWGDFVDQAANPSPSITSRFEIGLLFWGISFALYVIRKRKARIEP
jgi:hypothetical protein